MSSWFAIFRLFKAVTLHSLKHDYLRLILTLLAISLGVATMLAIRLANNAAVESFRSAALTVNSDVDLIVTSEDGIQAEDFPIIERALLKYGEVSPLRVGYLKNQNTLFKLYAADLISGSTDNLEFELESFKDLLQPGSLILSEALLKSLGKRPTEVLSPQGELKVSVAGSFAKPAKYALCDLSQLPYFFGDSALTRVELTLSKRHSESLPEVKKELEQSLAQFKIQTPVDTLGGREKMVNAFHFNMNALGYISILVGLLVVLTVTTLSLRRRTYQLGLLRTLGASNTELKAVVLLENILLGLPAIALGLFLGSEASAYLISASAETTAVFYLSEATQGALKESELNILEIAFVSLLALGSIYLATEIATTQLKGSSDISLLRGQSTQYLPSRFYNCSSLFLFCTGYLCSFAPAWSGIPFWGFCSAICYLLAAVMLFPLIFKALLAGFEALSQHLPGRAVALMALSGSRHGLPLIIPAASSLIVSMAMTVAVLFMVGSFRETVKLWIEGALTADIVLRPALNDIPNAGASLTPEFIANISDLAGVNRVEPLARREIEFRNVSIDLVERQFASNELPFFFKERLCVQDFLSGKASIVSETFSLRFDKHIGETIQILDKEFPICAIHYDYAGVRGEVYLALQEPREDAYTTAAIFLKPGVSAETIKERILNQLKNPLEVLIVETSWLRSEVLRIFDQTFVITYAVLTLSLIIAGMGVFAALVILGLDQRSALTMFRSLGASRTELVASLMLQTTLLAVASFISALISGLLIGYVLAEVINPQSFFWTIALKIEIGKIIEVFLIFLATALLASSIAVGMALRLNLREISRDE